MKGIESKYFKIVHDFRGVSFTGENFKGSSFREANLMYTSFFKARLEGSDFRDTDLSKILWDTNTKWPEGYKLVKS